MQPKAKYIIIGVFSSLIIKAQSYVPPPPPDEIDNGLPDLAPIDQSILITILFISAIYLGYITIRKTQNSHVS